VGIALFYFQFNRLIIICLNTIEYNGVIIIFLKKEMRTEKYLYVFYLCKDSAIETPAEFNLIKKL